MSSVEYRDLARKYYFGKIKEKERRKIDNFIKYIDAYSEELKLNEGEILNNDDNYSLVFDIFSRIEKRQKDLVDRK
jgi:hypothetical protein